MKIEMVESEVGNRLRCKCSSQGFFIQTEAEEAEIGAILGTIECIACHRLYRLSIEET